MSALRSSAVVVCVCCIACSVVGVVVPDGRMKKIVNLIFGAFLVLSLFIPLIGLSHTIVAKDYSLELQEIEKVVPDDKAYEQMVLNNTADNLVKAADDLLKAEGIYAENIELGIKKSDNNSIYISKINIYINENDAVRIQNIKSIIERNMSKEPVVIVNE